LSEDSQSSIDVRRIASSVGERRGWDFSRVRDARDPVPWEYVEVVLRFVRQTSRVLDIGTGGGEYFLSLAPHFGDGIGIDSSPSMIQVAHENTPKTLAGKISFEVMDARNLGFPDAMFDVVLNRHAPVFPAEIVRVLRPQGIFITQQVGERNMKNICSIFGCRPGGKYKSNPEQSVDALIERFKQNGCDLVARAEYEVRYWFLDVKSLIFLLKAVPLPEDFDIAKHQRQVEEIITKYHTPKGIETKEHRKLLILQKCCEDT